jgi:thiol-disulfide isomerase/thioredoxin
VLSLITTTVRRRVVLFLGIAALVAAGIGGFVAPLDARTPPMTGTMVKFVPLKKPAPAPETPFISADGRTIKLADLVGKVVLVNFWATWCAPCVAELPSLDRLQADLGGPDFEVLLISIDRGGDRVYEPFLEKLGIRHLSSAGDARGTLLRELKAPGVPVSYVIDADGLIRGTLLGDADWASPEAKALIRHYIDAVST